MVCRLGWLLSFGVGLTFLVSPIFVKELYANDATPAHSLQILDDLNSELILLHEYNETKAEEDLNAPALTKRMPRHVYQYGRAVYEKLQQLRKINNLPSKPIPELPNKEIVPADVRHIADLMMADMEGLRQVFAVEQNIIPAQLKENITPIEVYQGFSTSKLLLNGLGIPKIVPNDIFRQSMEINFALEKISHEFGITSHEIKYQSKQIKPFQVYNVSYSILKKLKQLVAQDKVLTVPGGIVLPNKRDGKITPEHVMLMLNHVTAEVHSIALAYDFEQVFETYPVQAGKTPSDSYDVLLNVHKYLDLLLGGRGQ